MAEIPTQNILQTALDRMTTATIVQPVCDELAVTGPAPYIVAVPNDMRTEDLTAKLDAIATKLQPWRRTGTAQMQDLQSLILWANRHKGDSSALFADTGEAPSLTCIADYQGAGAPVMDATSRDPAASHTTHRAVYNFPLSAEWKLWTKISGKALTKADLGDFIEANAKDMIEPSDQLINGHGPHMEPWERAMWEIARQVQGRFGACDTLIQLSRRFEINERSTLAVSRNPDTGESSFQFVDEHMNPDGSPIRIPNLFMIAVPVFDNGPLYRLAVRFRYAKSGADVKFALTLHNPDIALRDALDEALAEAETQTALPLFRGKPERTA